MAYSRLSTDAFARLAEIPLPSDSRVFSSSWCPTMDLLLVAVPLSNRHRLTMWRMGGVKVWDIEVGQGDASEESIVDVAWSPNGLQIAVAHQPPRISIHSCHDGSEIRTIGLSVRLDSRLTGVWWNDGERRVEDDGLTELLRRAGNTPGSALSLLQMLPLLDAVGEDPGNKSTQLYNIKKGKAPQAQTRVSFLPPELQGFPTLVPDLIEASISNIPPSAIKSKEKDKPSPTKDKMDRSLENTMVVASDSTGTLHLFLDGSYALGTINLRIGSCASSVAQANQLSPFFVLTRTTLDSSSFTSTTPTTIQLPLLDSPAVRNVAKVSTVAHSLLTYTLRVLEDMRRAWFGTDSLEGGRDVGQKWIKVLEEKERLIEGPTKTSPIFELTNLLFTGKTSPAMREFLGGNGKLSERGMAQWEATVHGALTVLQESAERQISPACERLIVVLEEVRGWSAWSQRYSSFMFNTAEIDECLALGHRAIEMAEWLSKTAQTEFERFHEFMRWMKAETLRVNDGVVGDLRAPTYDPLEVSEYLEHGLLSSTLDRWFIGPVPQVNPSQVEPAQSRTMGEVLEEVRAVIADQTGPSAPAGDSAPLEDTQDDRPSTGLDNLDRNLVALVNELAVQCARIFTRASGATGRQAAIHEGLPVLPKPSVTSPPTGPDTNPSTIVRNRVVVAGDEGTYTQYIAVAMLNDRVGTHSRSLAVYRLQYENPILKSGPSDSSYCVFECRAEEDDDTAAAQTVDLDILDLAFFDEDTLLVVVRTASSDTSPGRPFLLSVPYGEADYTRLSMDMGIPAEMIFSRLLKLCDEGTLSAHPLPIRHARLLNCCAEGTKAKIAVNGRENRRCACVVDGSGQLVETFDIDAEGDDEEEGEEDAQVENDGDASMEVGGVDE